MDNGEQEAMKIIKTLIKPFIPIIAELIDEHKADKTRRESEREQRRAARYPVATPTPITVETQPQPTSRESKPLPSAKETEEEKAYALYQALPERLKTAMSGLVNGNSLHSFEQSVTSIVRFWEFCKTEVQSTNGAPHSAAINDLFTFFFERRAPHGSRYEPSAGERFNPNKMTYATAGKRTGIVEETILAGFSVAADLSANDSESLKYKAVVRLV